MVSTHGSVVPLAMFLLAMPKTLYIMSKNATISKLQLKKSPEEGGFGFTDEEISWLGKVSH